LVQQEPVLFSGTVYENVAFGLSGTEKANLPESEQRALVEKACKDAYAEEFIERLPKVCCVASPIFTENSLTLDRVTIHNSASAL
jgi:ABC-type multidrug transport system fused ATPase/permease subunit